jgi:DNA-binding transcriptional LysR family regulator
MTWSHIRRFDERSIRYFIVTCEEKSVNAAAERLRIAPSAIRRKLKELEGNLGVELLFRDAHGVEPTSLGRIMFEYFSERFVQDDNMIAQLLERSRMKCGRIRVAIGEGFAADFLSSALPVYRRRHPDIRLDIQVLDTDQIVHALEGNEADIGLTFNPPPVQQARLALERVSRFACFVPQSWDHVRGSEISIEKLADQPCGLLSRTFSARRLIDDAERVTGVRLNVVLETNSLFVLRQFVSGGNGISIMPDFTMQLDTTRGDMRALLVVDPALKDVPVRAYLSEFSKDDPPTLELLRIMKAQMSLFRGDSRSSAKVVPRRPRKRLAGKRASDSGLSRQKDLARIHNTKRI